jgi:hypothetical protein
VFDRKGKTLFTKRYAKKNKEEVEVDEEQLSEQRKLVFGMLFSLREVASSLTPDDGTKDGRIHSVKTGASTLYSYETNSGLRFALYMSASSDSADASSIRSALSHVYNELWINCVARSPLYNPISPNVQETSFEQNVDEYFSAQSWYR